MQIKSSKACTNPTHQDKDPVAVKDLIDCISPAVNDADEGKDIEEESPYGQVMLQNPYFTAPNPHMTSHQFNKSAKKKKLTHTMRNTQRENRQTTPTKETPGQTKPTAGRGSEPTLAVGLAKPTPAVGLDPHRQWVWTHAGNGSGTTPTVGLVPCRQWVWPDPTSNPPKSASKLDSNAPQIISNASKFVSNASKLVFEIRSKT
jgi:hypothetical protein